MEPRALPRELLRGALELRRAARRPARRRTRAALLAGWAAQESRPGALALAGDSLVARLPADLLAPLDSPRLLRGHPGELTRELDERIDELLGRRPATLVLLSGTNDVLRGRRPAAVARDHARLLAHCRAALPEARLVICALPPITPWRARPAVVRSVNAALLDAARAQGARVADASGALADPGGAPRAGTSTDGVHLTREGYRALLAAVVPLL